MESNPYEAGMVPIGAQPKVTDVWSCRNRPFWIALAIGTGALIALPVAFMLGGVLGQGQLFRARAGHQQRRIERFLAEHPDKFGSLTVEHASDGWAYPKGTVATQADYDLLDTRLNAMFGDELAEEMMDSVDVLNRRQGNASGSD